MLSRNRSAIGPAGVPARGNRRRIGHQWQQIGARWSGNVDPVYRIEDSCDQRIEIECGKLAVVHRLRHAPVVLAACADDQFVDQRIAEALNLSQAAQVLSSGSADLRMVICCLEVVAHAPIVPFGSVAAWIAPSLVSSVIGTSIAMVLTLNPATEFGAELS